jgi:hypothetical protein
MFRTVRVSVVALGAGALLWWYASGSMPAALAGPITGGVNAAGQAASSAVAGVLGGGAAAADVTGVDGASITLVEAGRPVGWATCDRVPVLVNPGSDRRLAPTLLTEAQAAIARIAEVSGVPLVFAGTSAQVPSSTWARSKVRVDGYPYAPVLIGWAEEGSTDLVPAGTWGSTVANPVRDASGSLRLVTAAVGLNLTDAHMLEPGFGPGLTRGSVLLHELGHVVGLGHDDEGLMAAVVGSGSPGGFTAAERAALASIRPTCTPA